MSNKVSYFNPRSKFFICSFQRKLRRCLREKKEDNQPVVILCIGTDRATGDCLGPLVGQELLQHHVSCPIYGSLSHPVHARNLTSTLCHIYRRYDKPFIIAIDACLGVRNHVGLITVSSIPLLPGQGVDLELPPVGHLSITGIVNATSEWNIETIQTTSLYEVTQLASYICCGLVHVL